MDNPNPPPSASPTLVANEVKARPVMSCYALDLSVAETSTRAVMSCYALDLPNAK